MVAQSGERVAAGAASAGLDRDALYAILNGVADPEIPVLSVVELGVVRDVEIGADGVTVVLTPTYSGCPAMQVMEDDIVAALRAHGVEQVRIRTVFAPAWTTDWLSDEARDKLRAFGIAAPGHVTQTPLVSIGRRREAVACPYCGASDTALTSEFSSTACKAMHACRSCRQPFEEFKAI